MVQGERLSAVAKRRQLNGDAAIPSSTSTPLSDPTKIPPVDLHKTYDEANSFGALVENNSTYNTLVKEVATVSPRAVVVRLSEGAKCPVSGVYRIWVKRGAVSINCAVLDTQSPKQTVYAPRAYSIPIILGHSREVAEFEICEVDDVPEIIAQKSNYWATPDTPALHRSFIILGLPTPLSDDFRPSELSDLPTWDVRRSLRIFARNAPTGQAPIIALTGARIQGVSAHISMIINQLISVSGPSQRLAYPRGLLLVDCDPNIPEFSPPGTISFVEIRTPLLGPPFTHPGVHTQTIRSPVVNHVLSQEWVGTSTTTRALKRACRLLLTQAVHRFHEYKDMPLLIKGWDYFNSLAHDHITEVATELKLSHVFSFCSHKTSDSDRAGRLLATTANVAFESIHIPTSLEPSLVEQHKLSLQSHLHASQDAGIHQHEYVNTPFAKVPSGEALKSFYYGKRLVSNEASGRITAIWPGFDHDYSTPDYLSQSLIGLLVAIVLEPREELHSIHSNGVEATKEQTYTRLASTHIDSRTERAEIVRDVHTRLPIVRSGTNSMHMKRCLGLGVIKEVDCKGESIKLWSPVSIHTLRKCREMNVSFHLHLVKKDIEGRNDTFWATGT